MVNRHELPKTPPRPGYSINFSSEKCNGKVTLCNQEALATKSHIQYKNDLSSEVDNYYGEGKLNNNTFIRHGIGTYHYSEGCKYFGCWDENKKIGLGVFIYSNSVISFGERDINNQISNCLIYWPNSSMGFSQAFLGTMTSKTPLNGLFYVNNDSSTKRNNNMLHYLYCGKRNQNDEMDDDEAILYDFNRNFLFIGILKNNIIVMGYEIILSSNLAIENILFIIRNPDKNQLKEVVTQEFIATADKNMVYRRANQFMCYFLRNPTLVEYLNDVHYDLLEWNQKTCHTMPSQEIIDMLKKKRLEISTFINKAIKSREVYI